MRNQRRWPRAQLRQAWWLSWTLLVLAWVSAAKAEDMPGNSRAVGMGEAMTAGASGSAAIWHNPAGVLSAMMYAAEAGYAYQGTSGASGVTASILDTKSNPSFGLGMAFTYETANRTDLPSLEAYHVRVAGGFPLLDNFLKLGTTLRYSYLARDEVPVLEALLLDVGLILQFTDAISAGFTAHNLVNGGYDEELPLTLSGGLAFAPSGTGFLLSADMLFDMTAPDGTPARTWRVGGEYLIQATTPLRLGYQFNEMKDSSFLSAGVGFRDAAKAVGFDVGFQQNLSLDKDRNILASLSLYL